MVGIGVLGLISTLIAAASDSDFEELFLPELARGDE
jgi:hypothetical protein